LLEKGREGAEVAAPQPWDTPTPSCGRGRPHTQERLQHPPRVHVPHHAGAHTTGKLSAKFSLEEVSSSTLGKPD